MARKHSKKYAKKALVNRVLVTPARTERKVVLSPITSLVEVQHVTIPAVMAQGKAYESTMTKGKKNIPPASKKAST